MKKIKTCLKLIALIPFSFLALFLSSCDNSNVVDVRFATDNNEVTIGNVDFSQYKLNVFYKDGSSEQITVDESMIDNDDIFKLYEVGEHDITFYYDNFYTTATFIVKNNEFSNDIKFLTNMGDVFVIEYDGKSHSLELTNNIPAGTEIIYPEGNSFRDCMESPTQVRAILTKDGYADKTIVGKIQIIVNEFPSDYLEQIEFSNLSVTYDGKEKNIEANNLPEEIEIAEYKIFDSNGGKVENAVDAGEYTVTAYFQSKNHNYIIPEDKKTKTAKLTIDKALVAVNSLSLDDITKTYDGNIVNIKPAGIVPEGVEYDVNITDKNNLVVSNPKDVGTYNVEIIFRCVDNNHSPTPTSISSTLTINKRTIDLSSLSYGLEEVNYDGSEKEYTLINSELSKLGISLVPKFTYTKVGEDESTTPIEAGSYLVNISFDINNDNLNNYELINIPQESAVLIINEVTE